MKGRYKYFDKLLDKEFLKKIMEKKEIVKENIKIFWVFIIGSLLGYTLVGEQLAIGDWKMSIVLYGIILIFVAILVFIINKLDKDKITKEAKEYIAYAKIAVDNMKNSANSIITLNDLLGEIDILPRIYTEYATIERADKL